MKLTSNCSRIAIAMAASFLLVANASANLLANPSFELAPFGGAEEPGAGAGWTAFGNAFRIQGSPEPIGSAGAFDGTVVLKGFFVAGAFQDLDVNPGDTVNAGVWIMSPTGGDEVTGFAAVNLEFRNAGGDLLGDILTNNTFDSSAPEDEWIEKTISGVAPEGAASVRFALFANDGGAPRFDAASLDIIPIPVPAAVWLFGSALGLLAAARRRISK